MVTHVAHLIHGPRGGEYMALPWGNPRIEVPMSPDPLPYTGEPDAEVAVRIGVYERGEWTEIRTERGDIAIICDYHWKGIQ